MIEDTRIRGSAPDRDPRLAAGEFCRLRFPARDMLEAAGRGYSSSGMPTFSMSASGRPGSLMNQGVYLARMLGALGDAVAGLRQHLRQRTRFGQRGLSPLGFGNRPSRLASQQLRVEIADGSRPAVALFEGRDRKPCD